MGKRGLQKMVLSDERKHQVTLLFRAFDYDSSGSIDAAEFLAIGKAVKGDGEWSEEQNAKAMAKLDTDKSGTIEVGEFLAFFDRPCCDESFNKRMDKYNKASVEGRSNFYLKQDCALCGVPEDAPESYKKKLEAEAEQEACAKSKAYISKQQRHLARREQLNRAEAYAKEYASAERELIRQRRQAKAVGNYFCEPEAKLMFVIRIRGMCDMHPKTKKILQLLRLRQIHLGVFLRVNKATQEMIKRVEPYLAYGYPSLKATRALIYKRGFGKAKTTGQAQRLPLTDNSVIEEHLGQFGISCFEDLVHEIYTVGPHFKEANNFLWPFKLNSAKGGLAKKRLGFNEGGQAGNREKFISGLIFRML